ncbi:MAG TPA: putative 2OG-Fe(II) oxygenase [Parvularculaceae bacterium]|nr:putative 2OG-Fe(II) oxygenase [Parvularculaceae bacterium]HNS86742.1 putative 2OG-Fe(II) oxygenase [Parvularculaceae bacterium]
MGLTSSKCVRHDLFPTTVMTFEHDAPTLNASLAEHFLTHPRYARADQAEQSDYLNLTDLVDETEEFARLESMFARALGEYCRAIGWRGDFDLSMQMFPNVAPARHYVPSHNHVAHIAAVYYVQTPPFEGRPLIDADSDMTDYWRPEEGVLILHDPRFNASLNGGWQHFARVYPKPGLLVMFPAFLWHEVTPHHSNAPRLSVAANFTLRPKSEGVYEKRIDFSA